MSPMFEVTALNEREGRVRLWLCPWRVVTIGEFKEGTIVTYYIHDAVADQGDGIMRTLVLESGEEVLNRVQAAQKEAWGDDD